MEVEDDLWKIDVVDESNKQPRTALTLVEKEWMVYDAARRKKRDALMVILNSKFREFTEDGNYMKLHWHMKEEEEEEVKEDGWISLYFGYNPRLWEIGDYGGHPRSTIQVYKIKLTSNVYPLEVYGDMFLLSTYNSPQPIFDTDRTHSQTITQKDPYLLLTGPFCPPYFTPPGRVYAIEARLILKGTTESDDKFLGLNQLVGVDYDDHTLCPDDVSECCEKDKSLDSRKNYLLELTHGIVIYSVAATISVKLDSSSSRQDPELKGYYFTAYISNKDHRMEEVVLLDSRDMKGAAELDEDSNFKLSRKTFCVEKNHRLVVHVVHDEKRRELQFLPAAEDIEEVKTVDISSCTIKVEVKWSKYEELFQQCQKMLAEEPVQQEGAAGKL